MFQLFRVSEGCGETSSSSLGLVGTGSLYACAVKPGSSAHTTLPVFPVNQNIDRKKTKKDKQRS